METLFRVWVKIGALYLRRTSLHELVCVGKVVAFRLGQVIQRLNYLVKKIKLVFKALTCIQEQAVKIKNTFNLRSDWTDG